MIKISKNFQVVGDNAAQCTLRHYKKMQQKKTHHITNLTNSAQMFQNIMKIAPTAYHHYITAHLSKSHQHSRTYNLTSTEIHKKTQSQVLIIIASKSTFVNNLIEQRLVPKKLLKNISEDFPKHSQTFQNTLTLDHTGNHHCITAHLSKISST